jgi:hypothetical protein
MAPGFGAGGTVSAARAAAGACACPASVLPMVRKVIGLQFPPRSSWSSAPAPTVNLSAYFGMWTSAQVANASHDGTQDSELRPNYEVPPGVGGMGMICTVQNVTAKTPGGA